MEILISDTIYFAACMDPGFDFDSYWKMWLTLRISAIRDRLAAENREKAHEQQQELLAERQDLD